MGRGGGERNRGARRGGGQAARSRSRRRLRESIGPAALLLALTVVAYAPALQGSFIWDDDVYITANPHLDNLSGLRDIWLRPGATMQYYPLAFTTLWVEHHLWGDSPAGYHAVNVVLHAACAVLLWVLLRVLGASGALLAAAIFAVHPVMVESVAWCAELKNPQSLALYLLCLLAWLRAAPVAAEEEPEAPLHPAWYALALLLFAAALLTKSAAVALPLVILLIAWWKRGNVGARDAALVAPLLAMGVAMGLMTVHAEKQFAAAGWEATLLERGLVAGRALAFYAAKLVWPASLCSVYPRWDVAAGTWWQYPFPLGVVGALSALWLLRARLGRGPLAAALSYALLLAPALGFFDVAYFRYSFVADHLQYHAAPALIALLAGAIALAEERARSRPLAGVIAISSIALVLALGLLTWRHAGVLAAEETRCADTIAKNPGAWPAMQSLGMIRAAQGRTREAIGLYRLALRVRPGYADAHNNLGVALDATGQRQAATREYAEAVRLAPDSAEAHSNLGKSLAAQGRIDDAIVHLGEAVRIVPRSAGTRVTLAQALLLAGRTAEATAQLEQALALDPGNAAALQALARARAPQRPGGAPPGR
jgi:protein O-mannosyl-transferase